MEIYKSTYQTIILDNSILSQTWQKKSDDMDNQLFKDEMVELGKAFDNKKPKLVLINMQNFVFAVSPEVQEWVNKNVNSKLLQVGTQKIAFVVSSDLFTKISVEQTLGEDEEAELPSKYFKDVEKAKKWLKT